MQHVSGKRFFLSLAICSLLLLAFLAIAAVPSACFAADNSSMTVSTMKTKGQNITGKANVDLVFDTENDSFPIYVKHDDITGDSWADNIKIDGTMGTTPGTIKFTVNGKLLKTLKFGYWYTVEIMTLQNGTPFLLVHGGMDSDGEKTVVYQYKNGKFVLVCSEKSMQTKTQGTAGRIIDRKVGGNTMRLTHRLQTFALGRLDVTLFYKLKNGLLSRTANTTASIKYFNDKGAAYGKPYVRTSRAFTTYTTNTLKKKAFTVKKGAKVRVTALNTHGGKLYLKIYNGKKSGWICAFAAPKAVKWTGYGPAPVIRGTYDDSDW